MFISYSTDILSYALRNVYLCLIVLFLCSQGNNRNQTMLPEKEGPGVEGGQNSTKGEDPSVSLFREYLRLKTVHPDPDYGEICSSQFIEMKSCMLEMCHIF